VTRSRTTVAVFALGVAMIAGLAVAAFVSGSHRDPGVTTTTGFDLPALQGSGRIRLAAYRGRPVVVTLFASWCTACQEELPTYAAAAQSLRGKVQFIAVDSQETGNGAAFANHYRLSQSGFALAKDIDQASTGGLYAAFAARGLPLTAFYSPNGHLLFKANEALTSAELHQELQQYAGVA
jgi:cytochrome c biogenesis protein CcmG, thiol:disulfide interchange protein DsbE